MKKKKYNFVVIGIGLLLFYGISCLAFLNYLYIPEVKSQTLIYVILFGVLSIGSIGIITLREWARKLMIALNLIIACCFAVKFIPQVGLVPMAYLFLSLIVMLYFTQSTVKVQFLKGKYDAWHRSILVIDDDEMVSKILRPILFSHGYSVLTATTGEDGLQIVKLQKPDLVLLDVILPGMKGREVCQKIKDNPETEKIPVLFLTAKNSPEDVQAEKAAGASGHLTKPIDPKKLIELIQQTLSRKK